VSLSQLAIAWVLGDDMATLAVAGGATISEVQENAVAAAIELTPTERMILSEGAAQ
jgi:aryl-alcohol dehydrogenase-like predicted oxidoreductase